MAVYAINGCIHVSRGDVESITKEEQYFAGPDHDGFNPQELGFEMRFGFKKPLKPKYGYWEVKYEQRERFPDKSKNVTKKKMYPCS